MRNFLDFIYRISGGIAAFFLVAIFSVVIAQVILNIINSAFQYFTGMPLGWMIPSYASFAGYFLGAATFFALAYTLQRGEHVRVSLVLQSVAPKIRVWLEAICCLTGLFLMGLTTYFFGGLILESWKFNDRSFGMVSIPLWIPQLPFFLGSLLLTVAFLDNLIGIIRTKKVRYEKDSVAGFSTRDEGANL